MERREYIASVLRYCAVVIVILAVCCISVLLVLRLRLVSTPFGNNILMHNVVTGESWVVTSDGISLRVLDNQSSSTLSHVHLDPMDPNYFNSNGPKQHAGCSLVFDYRWIDNRLFYKFTITRPHFGYYDTGKKYPPSLFDVIDTLPSYATYTIRFLDNNGLVIATKPIVLSNMMRQSFGENGPTKWLSATGFIDMSRRTYEHIHDWDFLYNFGDILKSQSKKSKTEADDSN